MRAFVSATGWPASVPSCCDRPSSPAAAAGQIGTGATRWRPSHKTSYTSRRSAASGDCPSKTSWPRKLHAHGPQRCYIASAAASKRRCGRRWRHAPAFTPRAGSVRSSTASVFGTVGRPPAAPSASVASQPRHLRGSLLPASAQFGTVGLQGAAASTVDAHAYWAARVARTRWSTIASVHESGGSARQRCGCLAASRVAGHLVPVSPGARGLARRPPLVAPHRPSALRRHARDQRPPGGRGGGGPTRRNTSSHDAGPGGCYQARG